MLIAHSWNDCPFFIWFIPKYLNRLRRETNGNPQIQVTKVSQLYNSYFVYPCVYTLSTIQLKLDPLIRSLRSLLKFVQPICERIKDLILIRLTLCIHICNVNILQYFENDHLNPLISPKTLKKNFDVVPVFNSSTVSPGPMTIN